MKLILDKNELFSFIQPHLKQMLPNKVIWKITMERYADDVTIEFEDVPCAQMKYPDLYSDGTGQLIK